MRDGVSTGGALVRAEHPWTDAQLAGLYDAFSFEGDLPLYLDLAAAEGGRVLEVACGSGRVLLPLVRAGHRVVGVDSSPHMLALLRDKLSLGPRAAANVRLAEADMRSFDVLDEGPFDLAIVAVKSFAYLVERADQQACLRTIAEHLRARGLLSIDFMHPRPVWLGAESGSMRDDLLQQSQGVTVSRVESIVSTDLARQVRVIRSAYEIIDAHGTVVGKRFVEWPYRFTFRFEAEHLLERAGFEIEAVYGGYAREPFTSESASMVFLARRT
ncbi:MAG TPA: class I SAM-dependent methyltransferase [Chloroflexota bacterium]|nr:class I SAM-dependent methyltransferase [Chloroflexota bacterium]